MPRRRSTKKLREEYGHYKNKISSRRVSAVRQLLKRKRIRKFRRLYKKGSIEIVETKPQKRTISVGRYGKTIELSFPYMTWGKVKIGRNSYLYLGIRNKPMPKYDTDDGYETNDHQVHILPFQNSYDSGYVCLKRSGLMKSDATMEEIINQFWFACFDSTHSFWEGSSLLPDTSLENILGWKKLSQGPVEDILKVKWAGRPFKMLQRLKWFKKNNAFE